jgi:hypothetical protein
MVVAVRQHYLMRAGPHPHARYAAFPATALGLAAPSARSGEIGPDSGPANREREGILTRLENGGKAE